MGDLDQQYLSRLARFVHEAKLSDSQKIYFYQLARELLAYGGVIYGRQFSNLRRFDQEIAERMGRAGNELTEICNALSGLERKAENTPAPVSKTAEGG